MTSFEGTEYRRWVYEAGYRRWLSLWEMLDALTNPRPVYNDLVKRYAEPHRKHHTLHHIFFCLREFDRVRNRVNFTQEIPTVELALWYHDAVYNTKAHDNEERSAKLVVEACYNAFVGDAIGKSAARLIMDSRHIATPKTKNGKLLADVDLAIFGQPENVFEEYEKNIRSEYAWVPDEEFARARSDIIRRFLRRPTIYFTAPFEAYEQRARANLERSLQALSK